MGNEFSYEQMIKIAEEGSFRYKENIPPGYEDKSNKNGLHKYGDLFVWKQIIEYAQTVKKDVLFITNDVKVDWYDKEKDAPQFELLKEFHSLTQKHFWSLDMKEFLYVMNSLLDSNKQISEEVIEEIQSVQNEEKRKEITEDSSYFENSSENLFVDEERLFYQELIQEYFGHEVNVLGSVPINSEWKVFGKFFYLNYKKKMEKKHCVSLCGKNDQII